ncbi:MAG: S-methyl-5'-thioadenosine phosphorylase [Sedimentisphaerales bacterium]|nr:S-methyl-5'-thioadenosine phosphorylase [Sedimentisphaerales bacterium]
MAERLIGLIGGTGLGDTLAEQITDSELHDIDTPFGKPSMPILVGRYGNRQIAFINRHGVGHTFSPSCVPYAANIFALKKLGVRTLIASGAVGSLREDIATADLILVSQYIDKTFRRRTSFFDGVAAVHCEMAQPVCPKLRETLAKTAKSIDVKTHHEGTYVCMEGPQFSTRAESLLHRAWGADLIGMTGMPEAKLAREAQMCYAMVALVSDYDCWKLHEYGIDRKTLLKEIIGNLVAATNNCLALLKAVLAGTENLECDQCSCRHSLDLAVWTDQDHIDKARRDELSVLFE